MKLARTIIIVIAMAITLLFAWQANSPAFAKPAIPVCGGTNLLSALQTNDPKAYKALLQRENKIVNGKGLLWKIEREGARPSYLYGTMHMSDDRLTTLPGPVADALDGAQTVALELGEVLDDKKMEREIIKNIGLIAFTDGRTLDAVLTKKELRLLKNTLAKYQMPYAASRIMKPWFVMLSLSLPLCEIDRQKAGFKALDTTIARTAKRNGAKIIGLESVREQFAAFEALSIKNQKAFLMSTLRTAHLLNDQIETMTQLYLQRRPAALWEFAVYMTEKYASSNKAQPDMISQDQTALKRFENELVIKRNKIMRKRALPLLEKGGLFIAVGALHLPGKNGLVALLKNAGYTLSVTY
jgi:uncharacterized protein YbaP (TraB family)